jgi:hypothetical protein
MVHPRKPFDSGYLQRQHGVQIWAFSLRVRTEKATSKTHRRWNTIIYNDICKKKPEQKLIKEPVSKKWPGNALLIASIQEYKWAIVAGVIPRLCQIGFVFAQPFLVRRVVLLMVEENSRATTFTGYGLIAAYGLVYFGITVGLLCTSSDLNLSDH